MREDADETLRQHWSYKKKYRSGGTSRYDRIATERRLAKALEWAETEIDELKAKKAAAASALEAAAVKKVVAAAAAERATVSDEVGGGGVGCGGDTEDMDGNPRISTATAAAANADHAAAFALPSHHTRHRSTSTHNVLNIYIDEGDDDASETPLGQAMRLARKQQEQLELAAAREKQLRARVTMLEAEIEVRNIEQRQRGEQ